MPSRRKLVGLAEVEKCVELFEVVLHWRPGEKQHPVDSQLAVECLVE